jgi:hypothetical protein
VNPMLERLLSPNAGGYSCVLVVKEKASHTRRLAMGEGLGDDTYHRAQEATTRRSWISSVGCLGV